MNNKALIWVLVVAIVILGGVTMYRKSQGNQIAVESERQIAIREEVQRPTKTLTTKYQYKDGQHVFVGDLELPTPCHSYNAEVLDKDGVKEISVTITEPTDELCAQVVTQRNFKVSFEGPADQEIIASLNGEVVNLNIFTIPDDEDIDDIEIFIKG